MSSGRSTCRPTREACKREPKPYILKSLNNPKPSRA